MLRNSETGRVAIVKGAVPQLEVFEFTIEGPFDGPDPHTHDDHTDSFYVLEGEVDFHVDGREFRGGPGDVRGGAARRPARVQEARAGDGAVPEHPRAGRVRATRCGR